MRNSFVLSIAVSCLGCVTAASFRHDEDTVHLQIREPLSGAYYRAGKPISVRVQITASEDILERWRKSDLKSINLCCQADFLERPTCLDVFDDRAVVLQNVPLGSRQVSVWLTRSMAEIPETVYGVDFEVGSTTFAFVEPKPYSTVIIEEFESEEEGLAPAKVTTSCPVSFRVDHHFISEGGSLVLVSGCKDAKEDCEVHDKSFELFRMDQSKAVNGYPEYFYLDDLEPGTHAICAYLSSGKEQKVVEASICLVIDVVLGAGLLEKFQDRSYEKTFEDSCSIPNKKGVSALDDEAQRELQVTIVGTPKLDGQKITWLRQMKQLGHRGVHFRFVHFAQQDFDEHAARIMNQSLAVLNLNGRADVSFVTEILPPLSARDLAFFGIDYEIERADPENIIRRVSEGLTRHQSSRSGNEEFQDWTAQWWRRQVEMLHYPRGNDTTSRPAHIVVFGNGQTFADQTLALAALAAGANAVLYELPNLFPFSCPACTVTVAPSMYACSHAQAYSGLTNLVVIPPGVDVDEFRPTPKGSSSGRTVPCEECSTTEASILNSLARRPSLCRVVLGAPVGGDSAQASHVGAFRCGRCGLVGFIARLEPEKSPGLFVKAAFEILRRSTACIKFVIVGDGSLRKSLIQLARDLDILDSVHFTGVLQQHQIRREATLPEHSENAMADALRAVDVVINPTLRAWSETFCIVNIEAMAAEIPVVSFGVGGTQEYIRDGENSIVVREADAKRVAEATLALLEDDQLRQELGANARQLVAEKYSTGKQADRYEALYEALASSSLPNG